MLITGALVYGLARYSTRRIREERSRFRDLYERDERQLAALLAMTRGTLAGPVSTADDGDGGPLAAVTEATAAALGVGRASIWMFDEAHARLTCRDLFEADAKRHTRGQSIDAADFPEYCGALARDKVIAAHEARTDRRTREFTASELVPHDIGAMLDAPILVDGKLLGVLCLQHVGGTRTWTLGEQAFVVAAANLIALASLQEDLRHSEARFREMAENLQDVFYNYDPNRDRLLYANRPFERIWGRKLEEAYANPMSYFQGIHPDDQAAAWEADRRQRLGEPTETEFRVVRPDESFSWVLDRTASILGADGNVERIVGTMRDITEIKTAQMELAESRRQMTALMDNLPGAVYRCRLDENWTMLFVSEGITPLTGYRPADFLRGGRLEYAEIIHAEDRVRVYRKATAASAAGRSFEIEYRIRAADGTEKTVWERGRFFADAAGGEGHIEGFILDITDRKRAEAERQAAEERLRHMQKLEAIGQLAGGVAHDFNNMLTIILVRAETALRKLPADATVHATLKEIHEAATRSAGLIRQLLTYARRQVAAPRVVGLNGLIGESLPMLHGMLGDDVRIEWQPDPSLWPVEIDPSQVDQILANLCLNARDALQGRGILRLETANVVLTSAACRNLPELEPGEYVTLTVSDTGTGMTPDTQARLFEPFFTTKEHGKGTGLGLPTVHGIVRQNHGAIEVESASGAGASFRIYLPRHRGASPAETAPPLPSGMLNALPSGSGETVLVAEDDTAVRRLACEILEGLGYAVLDAPANDAALEVARGHAGAIHLLMTDADKARDKALRLAESFGTLRPGAGVLFMSSDASGQSEQDAYLFVRKPFATAELALKIRSALSALSAQRGG